MAMSMIRAKSGFHATYIPIRPVTAIRPESPQIPNRIGLQDTVITTGPDGEAKIGVVSKLSKVSKARPEDGAELDQCGDPLYLFIGVTIHPDDLFLRIRPSNLILCDRYLRPGFVVKEVGTNRIGFVQGVKQVVNLKLLETQLMLRNVEAVELIDPWKLHIQQRVPVFLNGWIGRISSSVERQIFAQFFGNSGPNQAYAFSISWSDFAHMMVDIGAVGLKRFEFESSGFAFYPGRKIRVPEKMMCSDRYEVNWLLESPKFDGTTGDLEATIVIGSVELRPIIVDWIKKIPDESSEEAPPAVFTDLEIQSLGILRPKSTAALGDVRMYKMKPQDKEMILTHDVWQSYLRRRLGIFRPRSALGSLLGNNNRFAITKDELVPVEVVYLRSTAEVAWVDGKISHIDTTKICRVHSTFFEVGEIVKSKDMSSTEAAANYGVVQQVQMGPKEKSPTASVHWYTVDQDDLTPRKRSRRHSLKLEPKVAEVAVDVDTIRRHPKYNVKQLNGQNAVVYRASEEVDFTAGYVVSSQPDGKVRVRCLDGLVRRYWPHEVLKLTNRKSDVISELPINKT